MNQSDIEFTMGLDTSPAEQKLNSLQQSIRSHIIQEFDSIGGSSSPSATANGQKLQEARTKQREITDETKAQNREHNESYVKLSKLHKLLLSILGVWQAIKKAVQANVDMSARLNEEKGFFSVDSRTVFEANRDKTYAMVHRGTENLGKASPFSSASFDEFIRKMQEIRLKAMRGEGIADDQYVIGMQRMFDMLGIGENASDLLSNGNLNLIDLGVKMLESLENKGLPALQKMGGTERDLLTGDIIKIFGNDIADGVMAHLNKRAITGGTESAIQEIIRLGGNAVSFNDLTTATTSVTNSFAEFKKAIDELGQVLLVDVAPGFQSLFANLTAFSNWLADKLNLGHFSDERAGLTTMGSAESGRKPFVPFWMNAGVADLKKEIATEYGAVSTINADTDIRESIEARERIGDMDTYIAGVRKNKNPTSAQKFNALMYGGRFARTNRIGDALENIKGGYVLERLANLALAGGLSTDKWSPVYSDLTAMGELGSAIAQKGPIPKDINTYEKFVNYIYKDKDLRTAYQNLFGEGGSFDIGAEGVENPWEYMKSGFTATGWLDFLSRFSKFAGKEEFGDAIHSIEPKWRDENKDNIVQFGELELNIRYNTPNGTMSEQKITTSALKS